VRTRAAPLVVLAVTLLVAAGLAVLAAAAFTERIVVAEEERPAGREATLLGAAHAQPRDAAERDRLRTEAERLAERRGDAAARSRAANVVGILAFENAWLDPAAAESHVADSLEGFQDAVEVDPTNEDAKFNLELVLTLLEREEDAEGGAEDSPGGGQPGPGAGLTPPGRGY
jgi:hypothetical protein